MKSMAYTKEDIKKREKEMKTSCCPGDPAKYPYGLCLSLDKTSLEKLNIGELPEVGDEFVFMAKAKVQSVGSSDHADGSSTKQVSLQITSMEMSETETDKTEMAEKLYS